MEVSLINRVPGADRAGIERICSTLSRKGGVEKPALGLVSATAVVHADRCYLAKRTKLRTGPDQFINQSINGKCLGGATCKWGLGATFRWWCSLRMRGSKSGIGKSKESMTEST